MWIELSDKTFAHVEEHGVVEEYSPSLEDSSLRQSAVYTIGMENNFPQVAARINTRRLRDALIWPRRSTADTSLVLQQLHGSTSLTAIYGNVLGKERIVVNGPLYCTCNRTWAAGLQRPTQTR